MIIYILVFTVYYHFSETHAVVPIDIEKECLPATLSPNTTETPTEGTADRKSESLNMARATIGKVPHTISIFINTCSAKGFSELLLTKMQNRTLI